MQKLRFIVLASAVIAVFMSAAIALPCVAQNGQGFASGVSQPGLGSLGGANVSIDYSKMVEGKLYMPKSVDKFMAEVDKNHDGLLTKPEFSDAGIPTIAYLSIEWPRDYMTKTQLEHHPFPPEALDANGDLTVAGMKAYAGVLYGFDQISVRPKNVDKFMAAVDMCQTGRVNLKEWVAAGLIPGYFKVLAKGRGYFTKEDVLNAHYENYMMEPDGSLTLKSMKTYDAMHHPGLVHAHQVSASETRIPGASLAGHGGPPPQPAPKPYFPLVKGGLYAPKSVEPLMAQLDKNQDGKIEKAEWLGAGLPLSAYLAIEWPKDTITRIQLQHHPFPVQALTAKGELTVAGIRKYATVLVGFERISEKPSNVDQFFSEVDLCNTGRITAEEWKDAGLLPFIFDNLERQRAGGRGYLTKQDLLSNSFDKDMLEPDGSLTVESMQRYDEMHYPDEVAELQGDTSTVTPAPALLGSNLEGHGGPPPQPAPKPYFPIVNGGLYAPKSVDEFMAVVDKNHDGLLTKPEFTEAGLPAAAYLSIEFPKDTMTKIELEHHPFPAKALDQNGDLTFDGMKAYAAMLHGFDHVSVSPTNVDKFMAEVDVCHNGKITRKEWAAAGLMMGYYNHLAKGRDYFTKEDVLHAKYENYMMEPDGSLTLESMKAYDRLHHPGEVAAMKKQSVAQAIAASEAAARNSGDEDDSKDADSKALPADVQIEHGVQVVRTPKDYFPLRKGQLYMPKSVDKFMAEVDKNHDGLLTKPEFSDAGIPTIAYLSIEWPRDYMTKTQLEHHPFPPEALDANGDLTVAGMKAYAGVLYGFDQISVRPKNVDKFMAAVDMCQTGRVNLKEWVAAGLIPGYFKVLAKGRGYFTKEDVLNAHYENYMMEPDGSLTLKSMKTYDAMHHPGLVSQK